MPSFKFAGFQTGSVVALSIAQGAATAQAALNWGQAGGGGQPNASFTIIRVDSLTDANLIAPAGVHLRASSLTGFNVSEPPGDTNVYDPTQHQINFIWDFGDSAYVPRFTPNIPTVHRNPNIAYGKAVSHVYGTSGNYTVTCWAFDEAGNWGTATYTFQSGGNAGPILSQDAAFPGAQTMCYSPDNNFTGAPLGAQTFTTVSALNTAVNSGGTRVRILFRRGEVYNFARNFGTGNGLVTRNDMTSIYYGSYGPSSTPPVLNVDGTGPIRMTDAFGGACALDGLDFIGPWDAATETGTTGSLFAENGQFVENLVFHRCLISGMSEVQNRGSANATVAAGCWWFNDTRITNWKEYGIQSLPRRTGIIGCDLAQNVDALMGINQGTNDQRDRNLGNTHGPIRSGAESHLYVGCTSFFSRNGWSASGSGGSPTASQACWRFTPDTAITTYRTHVIFERTSFEGSGNALTVESVSGPASTAYERNRVFDKCLFVGTAYGADGFGNGFLNTRCPGMTIRNCYFYRPDVDKKLNDGMYQNGLVRAIFANTADAAALTDTPLRFYNNTAYLPSVQSRIGTLAPVFFNTTVGAAVSNENNIFFAPNLTSPLGTGLNGTPDFRPLGTSALAGFQCRFKGGRWNPPPIGSNTGPTGTLLVRNRREQPTNTGVLQTGDVLDGQSILLPYPNYTGQAGYTLNVTQAMILGNPTQRHQVSITSVSTKRMSDPVLWPAGNGGVTISFQPTFIRVTNNTGSAWTSGEVWMQLDLEPQLMAFDTPSPTDIPAPIPQGGSAANVADRSSGAWAHDEILATYRQGVKTPPNGVVQTGKTHRLGAFG